MLRCQPAVSPLAGGLVASAAGRKITPLLPVRTHYPALYANPSSASFDAGIVCHTTRRLSRCELEHHLSWPFAKRTIDPAERARAMAIYQRLFTQPRSLRTLRVEFDAAVKEGSARGTNPELLNLLQSHASKITKLMSAHWGSVLDGTEDWPRMRTRKGYELSAELQSLFVEYITKTLRWLEYFVLDPTWLNLTAVNYAANAARETASEVHAARRAFEAEFELDRSELPGAKKSLVEPGDDSSHAA
jgi:hypothetical protein